MQDLVADVNWLVVVLGAIISFFLGAGWFSPAMFGRKWKEGLGAMYASGRPMMPLLITQALTCLFWAWLLVAIMRDSMPLAVLAVLTGTALVKANGLFSGKGLYTVSVESGYVLVQGVLVIGLYLLLA
jgi:hypothetical protein